MAIIPFLVRAGRYFGDSGCSFPGLSRARELLQSSEDFPMRRSILIIPALAGALGAAAPAFAQSDDVLGDEEYPADDYTAAPAEEYAGEDVGSSTYDDVDSYTDDSAYTDDTGYEDSSAYDDSYADRTVDPATFRSAL